MKVGISTCSNGLSPRAEKKNDELMAVLRESGIEAVPAEHIYAARDDFSGTDRERAAELMEFYSDDSISSIYDISGGDLANGVLKYLDFDLIADAEKTFWGYSDLTTVINAIYTMTGKQSVLWQIRNLVGPEAEIQQKRFRDYLGGVPDGLFGIRCSFLQGKRMEGVAVGGNIRCFTKLAGTKYWPDMHGKILLLESLGGGSGQIATLFAQLEQIGVFEQIAGVLLGTFTNYEKAGLELPVYELLKMHIDEELPVAATREIGHGHDSKAVVIGKRTVIEQSGTGGTCLFK